MKPKERGNEGGVDRATAAVIPSILVLDCFFCTGLDCQRVST
jgi:hypothetical protein